MSDLILKDRRGYSRRRPQAAPYAKPGIWPTLGDALRDIALGVLAWVGVILAVYWIWLR